MSHRLVHVSFMFPGVPKVLDLEPTFSTFGDWIRISQAAWLVWSETPTMDILNALEEVIDKQDNVFITPFSATDFMGSQPPWVWDWLKARAPTLVRQNENPEYFRNRLNPPGGQR